MPQKAILIITDGIGHNPSTDFNAFKQATTPAYDKFFATLPHSLISTYGHFVGLPEGQMGNSEVGHMSLGSGQVLYQDLVKITQALKTHELEDNPVLEHFLIQNKDLHLLILASDGGVHSHVDHLLGFISLIDCKLKNLNLQKKVFLHLFTDGRDVLPKSAKKYLSRILDFIYDFPYVQVASISGRAYAMDRDKRWERIALAHACIAFGNRSENIKNLSPLDYIQYSYDKGELDEFIKPTAFGEYEGIKEGDGVFFLNFRSDRARELVMSLSGEVEGIKISVLPNILTLTCYDKDFPHPILFPKEDVKETLAEVISGHGLSQAHIAETEKYAHVTFFFNGGVQKIFPLEKHILVPSLKVKSYDECPQMSAFEVKDRVLECMYEGYDFIVVNFANGDMVGHTGNFEAAVKAVESVDACLGEIFELAKKLNYGVVLTSDHGNCEKMRDENGQVLTNHTVGDVWCFVLGEGVEFIENGTLANIAPTVLKIMGLPIPHSMHLPLF